MHPKKARRCRMTRAFTAMLLPCLMLSAGADFEPENVGHVETLPEKYPAHWAMIHDFSFLHMFEGEVLLVEPLATDLGGPYKGMMPASSPAAYARSELRNEHYVAETLYSRGTRGGDKTDVLTIWDPVTLRVMDEIEIPPKRVKNHSGGR